MGVVVIKSHIQPWRFFLATLLAATFSEWAIMALLGPLEARLGAIAFTLLDGLLLALLLAPVIYWLELKPLRQYVKILFNDNEALIMARHIFDHGEEAVAVFDGQWRPVFRNSAFCRLFGLNHETMDFDFEHLFGNQQDIIQITGRLACDGKWSGQKQLIAGNGEQFAALLKITEALD